MVGELARARVLEECLQAMEQGETDFERLLSRYPEAKDEIRPLLDLARQLRLLRPLGAPLSLAFREELRDRLMANLANG